MYLFTCGHASVGRSRPSVTIMRVVAAERRVGQRELRVAHDRPLQQLARVEVVLFGGAALEEPGLQEQVVRVSVGRRMTHELLPLVGGQSHAQAVVHDRAGNLVLHGEQVRRVAVVGVGPKLPRRSPRR